LTAKSLNADVERITKEKRDVQERSEAMKVPSIFEGCQLSQLLTVMCWLDASTGRELEAGACQLGITGLLRQCALRVCG
jgi:hypothetical protein